MEGVVVRSRNRNSLTLAAAIVTALLAAMLQTGFAAGKPVNFAYQTPTLNGTLPIIVGVDFGFFSAEGLDVKPVFIRGGPTAAAALVGGDVDCTLIAGVPAVRAIVQGAPLTIISGIQHYMDYTLIGAKGINQLNDLKGKIVGVTGAGGIAEYAAVEGLAKRGFVRDRDYKVLYGVGNSPARAHALEAGRIQASPFSFLERIELEQKNFPILFDIGKTLPAFPFVVIMASKRKVEAEPDHIVALLRGLKRGLDFLRAEKDKVTAAVVKKGTFGDPATIRKTVYQFAELYSLALKKDDIDALIAAARIEAEAKKFGAAERFFAGPLLNKAIGQSR
jgi:ABC-type nitrate/sulfonate/bicarbonate transport system substrate-binding protein